MSPDAQTGLLVLTVREGPAGSQTEYLIRKGRTTVGRTAAANIVFPSDDFLSGLHFAIDWDGVGCRVVDLRSSNGTFLHDQRIAEAEIAHGALLQAGRLRFTFELRQQIVASPGDAQTPRDLSSIDGLFALVDACQDIRLPALLAAQGSAAYSLFDGNAVTEYRNVAPYLVAFSPGTPLLDFLIQTGWDRNWAVYFHATRRFAELRGHFRHFLMVAQDSGRVVYFRFYDPRVLRVFLGVCSYPEAHEFLGPVDKLWVAGPEEGSMLQFDLHQVGLFDQDPRVSDGGRTTFIKVPGTFAPAGNG